MTVCGRVPKAGAALALAVVSWFVAAASRCSRRSPVGVPREGILLAQPTTCFKNKVTGGNESSHPAYLISWFDSLLAALRDSIWPLLERLAKLVADFLTNLFGALRGSYSGGTNVVWLLVAVLLAWSIWKVTPDDLALAQRQTSDTSRARRNDVAAAGRCFGSVRASRPGAP